MLRSYKRISTCVVHLILSPALSFCKSFMLILLTTKTRFPSNFPLPKCDALKLRYRFIVDGIDSFKELFPCSCMGIFRFWIILHGFIKHRKNRPAPPCQRSCFPKLIKMAVFIITFICLHSNSTFKLLWLQTYYTPNRLIRQHNLRNKNIVLHYEPARAAVFFRDMQNALCADAAVFFGGRGQIVLKRGFAVYAVSKVKLEHTVIRFR